MNCDQFNQRLHVLLDERILPERDSALVQHASECSDCHSMLEVQEQLFGCLQPRQAAASRIPAVGWSAALAVTAAVIMVLVTNTRPPSAVPNRPSPSPSSALVHAPAENAVLLTEMIKSLPEDLALQQSKLTESIWTNPMSSSIRPVTDSMTSALNVIRRGWSRPEADQSSPIPQASRRSTSIFG